MQYLKKINIRSNEINHSIFKYIYQTIVVAVVFFFLENDYWKTCALVGNDFPDKVLFSILYYTTQRLHVTFDCCHLSKLDCSSISPLALKGKRFVNTRRFLWNPCEYLEYFRLLDNLGRTPPTYRCIFSAGLFLDCRTLCISFFHCDDRAPVYAWPCSCSMGFVFWHPKRNIIITYYY